jgi:hypothetical protein
MSRVDSSVIGPTLLLNTRGGDESVLAELVMIIAALLEKDTHFCIAAGLISIEWHGC